MTELRQRRAPSERSLDVFGREGISGEALYFDDDLEPNPIGVDRVLFSQYGRFEFERHGKSTAGAGCNAFVLAARDRDGRAADIVAWTPKRQPSHDFGLWLGRLPMLGMEQLDGARLGLDALPVHPDMASWLRAGRRGIVILDHWAAAPILHGAAPLIVSDPVFGRWLRDCLVIPSPRIVVGELPR